MNKLMTRSGTGSASAAAGQGGALATPGGAKLGRARPRVRTQWLALSAALVVLAGVVVAWSLSRAADRVGVVQVANAVRSGHEFTLDDLVVTDVAFDGEVKGLVPAASLPELVGRVAAVDLQAGVLMQVGMWRSTAKVAAGEEAVGVVLKPGRAPSSLSQGDLAVAASADPAVRVEPVVVRVLDTVTKDDGTVSVNLAVPAAQAVRVAQLAAGEQLVLVVRPAGGVS